MKTVLVHDRPASRPETQPHSAPVVSATSLSRRYGEGDAQVEALRNVSLDIGSNHYPAVARVGKARTLESQPLRHQQDRDNRHRNQKVPSG